MSTLVADGISYLMEIKEIKQRKAASLDNEFSIKLVTDDPGLMLLSNIPSDVAVQVTIQGVAL